MLGYLKKRLALWASPEIAEVYEDNEALRAELDQARFAAVAAFERQRDHIMMLMDLLGAVLLTYGGEEGKVTLAGDMCAAAAGVPPVYFDTTADGDVVMTFATEDQQRGEDLV